MIFFIPPLRLKMQFQVITTSILLFFVAQTMAIPSLQTRDEARKLCPLAFMVSCQLNQLIIISCGHRRRYRHCKLILELECSPKLTLPRLGLYLRFKQSFLVTPLTCRIFFHWQVAIFQVYNAATKCRFHVWLRCRHCTLTPNILCSCLETCNQ